jgi:DNA-binding beta-propeller fold protein YncE
MIIADIAQVDSLSIISTVAGTGVAAYSGDGGPATAADLNQPSSVAVSPTGDIYIADSSNNVVRKARIILLV